MEEGKRLRRMLAGLTALLCLAVGLCGALHLREAELQQQREMADVIAAMADIEVNLSKLLVASGARQSVSLLGETAILAQHVESGLSRLTAGEQATGDAMKFAGQMGQYSLALAAQVSDGGMLTGADERQIEDMMRACHALGEQLAGQGEAVSWPESETKSAVEYPALIYDGPFSDGKTEGSAALWGSSRVTRRQARDERPRGRCGGQRRPVRGLRLYGRYPGRKNRRAGHGAGRLSALDDAGKRGVRPPV